MHHCVATRADDILAGECYVYRVNLTGERDSSTSAQHSEGQSGLSDPDGSRESQLI